MLAPDGVITQCDNERQQLSRRAPRDRIPVVDQFMAEFEHKSEFPCSAQGLFEFLTRVDNIQEVSDPDLGIQFTDAPDKLSAGCRLDFKIMSFGQVLEITHEIVQYEHPRLVVEQQVSGPMASWRHHHEYRETENGVRKIDYIEFERPGGLIGFLLTDEKIIDQLEDGLHFRTQKLVQLIERGRIE